METVVVRTAGELAEVRARAERPHALLAALGAMVKSEAQAAFQLQRLGDIQWPHRYPNDSSSPFVNVAGVVQDFAEARARPKANRFQRRPAAVDTGTLQRSIAFMVTGNAVEIGSTVPYASAHNAGLVSRQPITESIRDALAKWLKSNSGKPYRKRLGFLFVTDVLETQVARRPFLGITDQMQRDFPRAVERFIARGLLPR